MVASLAALSNAGQAASYYEADDYYAKDGLAPSLWLGEGARLLGQSGEVDRTAFASLLEGQLPDGHQLGTMRDGERQHRPGWDITLSAPKSVSVMALVAGDERLMAAHRSAVKTTINFVEKHMAATRLREGDSVVRQTTGNLAIASFQHGTSRAQDPQLHSHNVILNMTRDATGQWRSLEPRALYQMQKQVGAIYRQELASQVSALGYAISTGKDSAFEIAGVPKAVLESFSARSQAIEARLEERGTSRQEASAREKQIAALDTREAKGSVDHKALRQDWQARAALLGFGDKEQAELITAAEERALDPELQQDRADMAALHAQRAVDFAIATLSERQSVFAHSQLQELAGRMAMGQSSYAAISSAIEQQQENGPLVPREFLDARGASFAGFTTNENIRIEQRMLAIEQDGRGALPAIANSNEAMRFIDKAARQSERRGLPWNAGQRAATLQLLVSRNRITALQGYAGTAKTSTVLATLARAAKAQGFAVTALAPTASAALTLGEALNARADTVARHFVTGDRTGKTKPNLAASQDGKALWIVDEASMLSARDTLRLFALAEAQKARVILVGDSKQLGSVEAGDAFAQLQRGGLATAHLTDIVRQSNASVKEAVAAALEGDARRALAALDQGGGQIIEHGDRQERFAFMARHYATLNAKTRAQTLVIEPSREGRDALTAEIRAALTRSGSLTGPAIQTTMLVNKGLTRAEARDPGSYAKGDVIRFAKDYVDKGVERSAHYRVEAIDRDKAAITLCTDDGRRIDWRLRQWGASQSQAFTAQPIDLKAGDRISFTRNDRALGRINGQRAEVLSVDINKGTAQILSQGSKGRGKRITLDLNKAQDQHMRHAFVETAFAAQGRTSRHVLIHADSKASNLIDQKSFYVALSRAKEGALVVTNGRAKLVSALQERAGVAQTAVSDGALGMAEGLTSKGKGNGAGMG